MNSINMHCWNVNEKSRKNKIIKYQYKITAVLNKNTSNHIRQINLPPQLNFMSTNLGSIALLTLKYHDL